MDGKEKRGSRANKEDGPCPRNFNSIVQCCNNNRLHVHSWKWISIDPKLHPVKLELDTVVSNMPTPTWLKQAMNQAVGM